MLSCLVQKFLCSYFIVLIGSTSVPRPPRPVRTEEEIEYDEQGCPKFGYTFVDPRYYKTPDGPRPMCYCGDTCILGVSGLYETLMMRYWKYSNFQYDPTKEISVSILLFTNKLLFVIVHYVTFWSLLQNPPPLCDFRQWIDTARPQAAFEFFERQKEKRERDRQIQQRWEMENERDERARIKREEEERKAAEQRAAERERKLERARRNKAAMEEGGEDALRKGKWPRCTQ